MKAIVTMGRRSWRSVAANVIPNAEAGMPKPTITRNATPEAASTRVPGEVSTSSR